MFSSGGGRFPIVSVPWVRLASRRGLCSGASTAPAASSASAQRRPRLPHLPLTATRQTSSSNCRSTFVAQMRDHRPLCSAQRLRPLPKALITLLVINACCGFDTVLMIAATATWSSRSQRPRESLRGMPPVPRLPRFTTTSATSRSSALHRWTGSWSSPARAGLLLEDSFKYEEITTRPRIRLRQSSITSARGGTGLYKTGSSGDLDQHHRRARRGLHRAHSIDAGVSAPILDEGETANEHGGGGG